jgi:hypothetical protein
MHVQPGPRDGIMQCFIKRDRSTQTYYLYLSLTSGMFRGTLICSMVYGRSIKENHMQLCVLQAYGFVKFAKYSPDFMLM